MTGAIRGVQLELLRSGKAHNQLLSPLTPYIALCGSAAPVTVHVPFEHQQLLTRLVRLRYGSAAAEVSKPQREAEIREMGEAIGRLFGHVPALLNELSNAGQAPSRLLNLRLSISAYELGMLPFETAIGPDGTPGSGSPLQLQSLISITREIRRGEQLRVEWNRPPRILFVFASPPGLPPVPAAAHVIALRKALGPWVRIGDEKQRVESVGKMLTVLPDATLEQLRDKVRDARDTDAYTHVHILAHGGPYTDAGNERYGLVLFSDGSATQPATISGEALAIALKGLDASGRARQPPTLVTLATCDSGNVGGVLVPGGSIAHELHTHGIPWVIASQFPLWMRASSIAAEVLYQRLLEGADPRWALHELRQRLRTDIPDTHDWASIVAYATIAPDLEAQVEAFRDKQTRRALETQFGRIDDLVGRGQALDAGAHAELESLSAAVRATLVTWVNDARTAQHRKNLSERLGMSAASEKRIAIAYAIAARLAKDAPAAETLQKSSRDAYARSRKHYQSALEADPMNHWAITQFLSISAVSAADAAARETLVSSYGDWWTAARQIAAWQLRHAEDRTDRAWALGTLAELKLLGAVYSDRYDPERAKTEIAEMCRQIRELVPEDAFAISSTLRQFNRYRNDWQGDWAPLAEQAVMALGGAAAAPPPAAKPVT